MSYSQLDEKYEFRDIRPEEAKRAAEIEQLVFPPNEAEEPEKLIEQVGIAPELFLVAVDRKSGELAGFLNGVATDEESFRDEFFTDKSLHDPDGRNIILLGLDVLPVHRGQGLASRIMETYCERERARGREKLILTCLPGLVKMYEGMGYRNMGISGSSWGGETWYEMHKELRSE